MDESFNKYTQLPNFEFLKSFLDSKVATYNTHEFIENDPISIPHQFHNHEDIEISAFLTATIAWGQRPVILKNAKRLMHLMDDAPADFVRNATNSDLLIFQKFVHRTFNSDDCIFFMQSLQYIYRQKGGLKAVFNDGFSHTQSIKETLISVRKVFFEIPHLTRSQKHFSDISKNASGKRLNMFLRWMVRHDNNHVDFGIWSFIPSSKLMIPLDIHSGNSARSLGLLTRSQNDWKAVEELTNVLKLFDIHDPVKYDFALFGMGVNKDII